MARQFSTGNAVTSVSALPSTTPTAISYALWFNPSVVPPLTQNAGPINLQGGGHSALLTRYDSTVGLQQRWIVNDNNNNTSSMGTLTAAAWNHLALTWDGTNWRSYLNGVAVTTVAASNFWSAALILTMGAISNMTWIMADLAVWSVQLTTGQITNMANGYRANHAAPGNMLIYWPILGQSPEPDKSGNANNGTVSGTTIVSDPTSLEAYADSYGQQQYASPRWPFWAA